jgi:uncharacterized membrane protein
MKRKDIGVVGLTLLLCLVLLAVPTGFEGAVSQESIHAEALVLEADNDDLQNLSLITVGSQFLTLELLSGPHKGVTIRAINQLQGKMEFDELHRVNEKVLVEYRFKGDQTTGYTRGHYRLRLELLLALLFAGFLVLVAGWTGFKALLSFAFAALAIWKLLIPLFLKGVDPYPVAVLIVALLTASVSFLVGGISRRGLVTFLGSFSGLVFASLLAVAFSKGFRIHGAVRPLSESLLYAGFPHLDLTRIFVSGIVIACSGAVMDLAMDLSAAMHEIHQKKPDIGYWEHVRSGLCIGRSVIGTMTTTLLLAYSGGYTAMLMFYMGQGTPLCQFFNINYVAAEILNIFVGSFGLVAVAPCTAFIAAFIFHYRKESHET